MPGRVLPRVPLLRGSGGPDRRLQARHQTAGLPAAAGGDDLLMVLVRPKRCGGLFA